MLSFLRNNGLTLALIAMFCSATVAMAVTGLAETNLRLAEHGGHPITLGTYIVGGDFLSALFENWESEFLQMAVYVVLTAMLFQKGSAESRDPDRAQTPDGGVPWRRAHPIIAWLYEHSLGLALASLFFASFYLHLHFSMIAANDEALLHGSPPSSLLSYLSDPKLWFESFQNWQSEFLSTAVLVVLSIFLRQRGSPESKPTAAPNSATGG